MNKTRKKFILSQRHQMIHDALLNYAKAELGRSDKTAEDYSETLERYLPRFMNSDMGIEGIESVYDVSDMNFLKQVRRRIEENAEWKKFDMHSHGSTFRRGIDCYIEFYNSSYFPFKDNKVISQETEDGQTGLNDSDMDVEGTVYNTHCTGFERNRNARQKCIEHYGCRCSVCGFDFEETYGELGKDFIEVHHIVPLSQIRNSYVVDAVRDLRPVCSNCHSMLHHHNPVLTIEELREMMNKK